MRLFSILFCKLFYFYDLSMNSSIRTLLFLCIISSFVYSQDLPPIRISYASRVLSSDGKVIGYFGEKNRVDVRSTGYISKWVIWSLVATEDRDFYNHNGVSYKGLARSIFKTLTGSTQGGSTITMQCAKNLFLTNEKTLSRKMTQIELAQKLEKKFSKDQILLMYLNVCYFGHSVHGIWAAAEEYFGKTPENLSITESATLVGILQNPGLYDPVKHADKLLSRRNEVLHNLVEVDKISSSEYARYSKMSLGLRLNPHIGKQFMESVRKEAIEILAPYGKHLNSDEMVITTTLNFDMQKAAEEAVQSQWNNFPSSMRSAQIGLITIENGTGMIRSMIGGNPGADARGLNRAVQIRRQPGSSFKAFLYGSMLKNGSTLATPLLDAPIIVDSGMVNEWRPQNSEETYSGHYIPMETAIQHSVNLAAAYAITKISTPDSVVAFAHQLGIQSFIPPFPSIALGTAEVSPVELASAYQVFASEGTYAKPYSIIKIEDKNGRVYYNGNAQTSAVLDSATCYLLTQAFETVVDSGTASTVRKYYKGFAAGKTGTSQNSTDAWFAGYTRTLTTAIWIGYDDPRYKLSGGFQYGGTACAPIWGRMMASIARHDKRTAEFDYVAPQNIAYMEICTESGDLAGPKCKHKTVIPVNSEKLPGYCILHQ
jgi:membrane peptidoglycan carboxypeptidase